jgi:hypothetical protein
MNRNFKFSIVLLLLFSLGCKKDILETQVQDQFTETNFLKTEADIKSAITPYYSLFGTDWGASDVATDNYMGSFNVALGGYEYQTSKLTDQMFDVWKDPDLGSFAFGPATFNSNTQTVFFTRIQFVARATELIDKLQKVEGVSDEIKNQYLGEIYCMRGWLMYILYDLYGPLNPILDPAKLSDKVMQPRMSDKDYTAAIEADLLKAIDLIPRDKYNGDAANWGRVSKSTALMVLLKLYVNTAKTPADWEKAKATGEKLIGRYSLNPSYKNVFIEKANDEIIYAVPGNAGTKNWWYKLALPGDAARILNPTVGLNAPVGSGWGGMGMNWAFYDKYTAGDKRLETIGNSYQTVGGVTRTRQNGLQYAIPMKYTRFVGNDEGFDWVMFRYADVLLYMAEITNELGGAVPSQTTINYLKQVSDRANETIPAAALLSKEAFRNFIFEERAKELYFENGNRRQDMIRQGTLISNARERGKALASPHHVLFPIPSDVIETSKGIIKQNPTYN